MTKNADPKPQTVLKVNEATLDFGGLRALSRVNMIINPGLITSVIGPNGAGKTSLLNSISGFYHLTNAAPLLPYTPFAVK